MVNMAWFDDSGVYEKQPKDITNQYFTHDTMFVYTLLHSTHLE